MFPRTKNRLQGPPVDAIQIHGCLVEQKYSIRNLMKLSVQYTPVYNVTPDNAPHTDKDHSSYMGNNPEFKLFATTNQW